MGRYEEEHYVTGPLSQILGEGPYETHITDKETGNKASGTGSTREEANRNAFNSVQQQNQRQADEKYWNEFWSGDEKEEKSKIEDTSSDSGGGGSWESSWSSSEDTRSDSSGKSSGSGSLKLLGLGFLVSLGLIIGNQAYQNSKINQRDPLSTPSINLNVSLEDSLKKERKERGRELERWIKNYPGYLPFSYLNRKYPYVIDSDEIRNHSWIIADMRNENYPEGLYLGPRYTYVFHSSDNQKNWEIQLGGGGYFDNPFKIRFFNENEGFVATDCTIFRTFDGGKNWSKVLERYITSSTLIQDLKVDQDKRSVQLDLSCGTYSSFDYGKSWYQTPLQPGLR